MASLLAVGSVAVAGVVLLKGRSLTPEPTDLAASSGLRPWDALVEAGRPADEIEVSIDTLRLALRDVPAPDPSASKAECEAGGGDRSSEVRPDASTVRPDHVTSFGDEGTPSEITTVKSAVNRMRVVQAFLSLDPAPGPGADEARAVLLQVQPELLGAMWSADAFPDRLPIERRNLCTKLIEPEVWGSRQLQVELEWSGVQIDGGRAVAVYDESRDGLANHSNEWSFHEKVQIQLELVNEAGEWKIARRSELFLEGA